jgi:glycosidase
VQIPMANQGFQMASKAGVFAGRKSPNADGTTTTMVGYVRFARGSAPELEIALIPGELYPELSVGGVERYSGADYPDAPVEPAIKQQMSAPYRMIFGLADDENGYILPKSEWDEKRPFLNQASKAYYGEADPLVSDYVIQNALWWIGMTGIDGIRQDTYPYVERAFWEKWQTAIDRQYPAMVVTGEITAPTPAVLSFFEGGTRRRGVDTRLKSMLDFPLEYAVRNVFAQGQAMTALTDILAQDSLYQGPERLVVFPGNHDQPRFLTLARGDIGKLTMAEAFVLTTRRVVHLYYGDEIAMQGGGDPDNRHDFPGGWAGDAANAFTAEGRKGDAAKVFDWTRRLLHFRAEHPAARSGELVQLLANKDQYAYLRSSASEYVLVLLNRAGAAKPLEVQVNDLGVPDGTRFRSAAGGADLAVSGRKIVIESPGEVGIWTAAR